MPWKLILGRVLATVLLVSGVWQCALHAGEGSPPAGKPKVTCLVATIKSVDSDARTIVLTTGEGNEAKDVTLKVCPRAKILIDGKAATLADVKAGATTRVCHIKTEKGDLVAVRIAVGAGTCPKGPK